MMKKMICSALLPSLMFTADATFACQSAPALSTMSFIKNVETVVKSTTALVNVTVNATALKDDSRVIQQAALQRLDGILPKVDWKVINLNETEAASGAQNIKLVIQARLSEDEIKTLRDQLKNSNSDNSSFSLKVVSYDPSNEMLDQAKDSTMIKLYQSIEQYVAEFNQKAGTHYVIQNIMYHVDESRFSVNPNAISTSSFVLAVDKNSTPASTENAIAVSKKIVMEARVTLAQPLPDDDKIKSSDMSQKMTSSKVLPPAYLSVPGFKACLETQDKGAWQLWCLPQKKPEKCSDDSWQQLSKMQDLPKCDN